MTETNVFQALIKRDPHFLDRPIEDLLPMRFMGLDAFTELIRNLNSLPLALEEWKAALKDAQNAGIMILAIEAKFGELLGPPEKGLPKGINKKKANQARAIFSHPEEVESEIREAVFNGEIPTIKGVLNKIAYKNAKEKAQAKKNQELVNVLEMYEFSAKRLRELK